MSGSSSQSTRTSPGSFGTTQLTESVSSGSSPPQQSLPSSSQAPLSSQHAMSTDVYSPTASQTPSLNTFAYPFSPIGTSASFDNNMRLGDSDRNMQGLNGLGRAGNGGAILMRKLPRNTSREALRSMLLFAKDFVDADFIPLDLPEDEGFLTAIARFISLPAAEEARNLLDGKPNSKNDANMIVEMYPGPMASNLSNARRNTIDHTASRALMGVSSNGPLARQSSRFNGTFQSLERLSNANPNQAIGDGLHQNETGSRMHSLFSPHSPIGNGIDNLPRITGKSMIDEDPDEETGELLKDPVGYAENGHTTGISAGRRATNPSIPTNRFANLSLSTNMSSPPLPNYPSGGGQRMGSGTPSSAYPNQGHNFPYNAQHTPRHSLPAANPNDLNPPCNTLYVGNLPPDTSEEELKALFSKQRGYKRLCFRNKQNGPMCFVEFDEVAMASKALNELYGYKLSNSVKTGIRLSFSKNPLGVRSGQPGSMNSSNSVSGQGAVPGGSNLSGIHNNMFSAVNGPPPGLAAPPGLGMSLPAPPMRHGNNMHTPVNPHAGLMNNNASYNPNSGLGIRNGANSMMMSPPPPGSAGGNGNATPNLNGYNSFYPDYMMGR
ncbi:hypothetical protein MYU51_013767 [Penicillium brevicompactum]|uniref:uncharacterized protein n=1 Tax=Penicillium brevicompactum TaxID=5074 RepID=UPI00253F6591|nr:uncharacterized protein N7506_011846 [Penicillium brevicompactum]KAJ5319142.1 hypothetical protein N7506_011846 [Penicillium brevicompactum]